MLQDYNILRHFDVLLKQRGKCIANFHCNLQSCRDYEVKILSVNPLYWKKI